jgi:nucleoside-diphosphate-sugar epimerase
MILVTGGGGYVGSVLVNELLALGQKVRVVDAFWFGNYLEKHPRLEVIDDDVRDCDLAWLKDATGVIHLAGLSNDPTADFAPGLNSECNVHATQQLAAAVADVAAQQQKEIPFLFASSCSVYYTPCREGDVAVEQISEEFPNAPTANYSKTKRLAEIDLLRVARDNRFFCPIILRKATVFGASPRMRFDLVVNTFTLHAWRSRVLTVHGHGEVWRPLVHIRDAVDAYIHLLWAPIDKTRGQVFNIVHKNYRLLELAHWIAEVIEQNRGVEIRVKRDRSIDNSDRSYYVKGDKIQRLLGFRADRGVAEAVLDIWDALEGARFGKDPDEDPHYFNIRWLRESFIQKAVRAEAASV